MNSPKRKNLIHQYSIVMRCAALSVALLALLASLSKAQQVEKLELVLSLPTINTDRGDGYQYEMRGNVYAKDTVIECGKQPESQKLGRYLLRVRQDRPESLIATFAVTLNDKRTIVWDSYSKYELDESGNPLSFAYEAVILRSDQKVLTDFTPQSPNCFGGQLVLYFLNGG